MGAINVNPVVSPHAVDMQNAFACDLEAMTRGASGKRGRYAPAAQNVWSRGLQVVNGNLDVRHISGNPLGYGVIKSSLTG